MQNNTELIVFVTIICTLWSGFIAWKVADWALKKQARLNTIKDIVKLVYRLISSSEAYWLSSGREKIAESQLIHKTHRLNVEINEVYSDLPDLKKELNKKIIELRREITGGQFESEDRPEEPGRASNIREIGEELIDLIKGRNNS